MAQRDKHRRIHYEYGTRRVSPAVDRLIVQQLKSRSLLHADGSGRLQIKLPPGITPAALQGDVKPCRFVCKDNRRDFVCVIDSRTDEVVSLPIVLHRPLPDGEVISVSILRRARADKIIYAVRFEMRIVADVTKFDGKLAVVNYDWRLHELAVDVATIWTEDGTSRITLPADYMSGWQDWFFVTDTRESTLRLLLDRLAADAPLVASDFGEDPEFLRLLSLFQDSHSLHRAVNLASYVQKLSLAHPEVRLSHSLTLLLQWFREDRRRWQHACRLYERLTQRRLDIYFNAAAALRKAVTAVFWLSKQTVLADEEDTRIKHGGATTLHRVLSQRFPQRYIPLRPFVAQVESITACTRCGNEVSLANNPVVSCTSCGNSWDMEQQLAADGFQLARQLVADGIFEEKK